MTKQTRWRFLPEYKEQSVAQPAAMVVFDAAIGSTLQIGSTPHASR